MGAESQKSGLNFKIPPKSMMFAPLDTPPKSFKFFYHHWKCKDFTNTFCRKLVSSLFGLGSIAYGMDATMFCSLREKRFFPMKRRHNDVNGGLDLPANVCGCLTDSRISSVTL